MRPSATTPGFWDTPSVPAGIVMLPGDPRPAGERFWDSATEDRTTGLAGCCGTAAVVATHGDADAECPSCHALRGGQPASGHSGWQVVERNLGVLCLSPRAHAISDVTAHPGTVPIESAAVGYAQHSRPGHEVRRAKRQSGTPHASSRAGVAAMGRPPSVAAGGVFGAVASHTAAMHSARTWSRGLPAGPEPALDPGGFAPEPPPQPVFCQVPRMFFDSGQPWVPLSPDFELAAVMGDLARVAQRPRDRLDSPIPVYATPLGFPRAVPAAGRVTSSGSISVDAFGLGALMRVNSFFRGQNAANEITAAVADFFVVPVNDIYRLTLNDYISRGIANRQGGRRGGLWTPDVKDFSIGVPPDARAPVWDIPWPVGAALDVTFVLELTSTAGPTFAVDRVTPRPEPMNVDGLLLSLGYAQRPHLESVEATLLVRQPIAEGSQPPWAVTITGGDIVRLYGGEGARALRAADEPTPRPVSSGGRLSSLQLAQLILSRSDRLGILASSGAYSPTMRGLAQTYGGFPGILDFDERALNGLSKDAALPLVPMGCDPTPLPLACLPTNVPNVGFCRERLFSTRGVRQLCRSVRLTTTFVSLPRGDQQPFSLVGRRQEPGPNPREVHPRADQDRFAVAVNLQMQVLVGAQVRDVSYQVLASAQLQGTIVGSGGHVMQRDVLQPFAFPLFGTMRDRALLIGGIANLLEVAPRPVAVTLRGMEARLRYLPAVAAGAQGALTQARVAHEVI